MAICFSFLYVENYRSIEKQAISFDHSYEYAFERDHETIIIKKNSHTDAANGKKVFGRYFYGRNIYSVTCLVGKNGEGKTSLVDFLRDSFALIKNDIDTESSEDGTYIYKDGGGFVELPKRKMKYYHLDENTRFFVIFKKDGENFFLTNIDEKRIKGDVKETCRAYIPKNQGPDYQVAYFSMMRFPNGIGKSEVAYAREKDAKVHHDGKWTLKFEEILERYNIDFSEEEMNRKREEKEGKEGINADLFMQLAFLKDSKEEDIRTILGEDYRTRIEAANIEFIETGERNRLGLEKMMSDEWDENLIRELLESPLAYLRPFSSGQYSRFAFLARLYWYMGGGAKFWESDNMKKARELSGKGYRDSDDEIKWLEKSRIEAGSVVLMIDEGELYYHPEWQRRFVKDVFDIISACKTKVNVQVVFTTSSTFMLSDILREDVVVLSRPNAEQRHYLDEDIQTFGQNIHMLLANRFFMDSTIGERAERLITGLFEMLADKEGEPADRWRERVKGAIDERFKAYVGAHPKKFESDAGYDEFVHELIESIGEDFYRRQLLGMFEEYRRKTRKPESQEALVRRLLLEKMETADAAQKESLMQAIELLGGKSGQ